MLRSQQHISLKFCTFAFLLLLVVRCADSARENIVDPIVAPTIEMSTPVLDGETILIEWR